MLTTLRGAASAAIAALCLMGAADGARAETATVAVAANFKEPIEALAPIFEAETGHRLEIVIGSTGQLYAQIANGAPFDVFLAADQNRPEKAVAEGFAVEGSRFTYAIGKLTLYSPDAELVKGPEALDGAFHALAIANPTTAPYGAAAQSVLEALGKWAPLQGRIAQAQNIGGAFASVRSGAAELGFVALSSVLSPNNAEKGSRWDPPQDLHAPLRQDAVLLTGAKDDPAAAALVDFLKTSKARELILRYGYDVE